MNDDSAAHRILAAYPRVYLACHTRHERRANNPHGLSRRDSQVLQHLDCEPPARAGELARHLGIGAPALSAAIDRLESRGYARRRAFERDRRQTEILLTDEGRRVMSSASVLELDRVDALLRRLTPNERDEAVRGLELLARAATELMERTPGEAEV